MDGRNIDQIAYARRLLHSDEAETPAPVRATISFLSGLGIWYQLSRNGPATSCRDAAHKRSRLGHVGIPLRDEMKSFFGKAVIDDKVRDVMAHCRGDRLLDLSKLAACIGSAARPQRLNDDEIEERGLRYGLVNPFETWTPYELDGRFMHAPSSVLQVFDRDLLDEVGCPGTVMTNAGDLTWAVEFYATELFTALEARPRDGEGPGRGVLSGDISLGDTSAPRRSPNLTGSPIKGPRAIAIITGNAPESGISLWQRINTHTRELLGSDNCGDVSMPPVRVVSLPQMGLTMELDRRERDVWERLEPEIQALCNARESSMLAIACNTTQYFVDRIRAICEPTGVEFICLPEVVAAWLRSQQVEEVALVGIPFVADVAAGYSAYARPLADFKLEIPSEYTFGRLTELAYWVKETGPNERGLTHLRNILAGGVESPYVVLALTELSILLELQKKAGRSGRTIIDPVELYAQALARRWLGLPFPAEPPRWVVHATGFTHAGQLLTPDTDQPPHNEDALLLGTHVISGQASEDAAHVTYQERADLKERRDAIVVGVADGLGGHASGELASSFVLDRLAMNPAQLASSRIRRSLREISDMLREEAARAGEHPGESRGATIAGIRAALEVGEDKDEEPRLAVTWFSVGDCFVLRLETSDHPDQAAVSLVSAPGVSSDGHPTAAIGLPGLDVRLGDIEVSNSTVLICATDGLASSFGYSVADPNVAHLLESDSRLAPIWASLVFGPGDPVTVRRALESLFNAARSAWDEQSEYEADDISVAAVRVGQG